MEKTFAQMTASEFQSLKNKTISDSEKLEPGFSGNFIWIKYKDNYLDAITPRSKREDEIRSLRNLYKTNAEINMLIKKTLEQECELRNMRQGQSIISWENFQKTKLFNKSL